MKLSIVIPNYNDSVNLIYCIKSVEKAKLANSEIIVIDDLSTDDSLYLVHKKFKNIRLISLSEHKGIAFVRNIGLKESKGGFILFVDSDVIVKDNLIRNLLNEINNYDLVFPKVIFENNRVMHPLLEEEKQYPQITACFIIKKESVEKNNLFFDEIYSYCYEDSDFFLRANLKNLKMKYVDEAVLVHKLKERTNKEKRFYLENRNLLYGIRKFRKTNTENIYHPFHYSSLFRNFIVAVFNYDKFDWSHYDRRANNFEKFKLLFRKHKKITEKNRLILIYYFFKAMFWNLKN